MKKKSIVIHILLLLMLVIILQSALSLNTIIWTNITTNIESFSYSTFTKTVQNRKSNLESFMNSGWSNINNISENISENYMELIADNKKFEDLTEEEKTQFLSSNVENIIEMISKARTTGGFIILNDGENMKYNYSTLYLKSENYLSQVVSNENLMLVKGSSEISKEYNFSLSRNWSYALELDNNNIEILKAPIEALDITKNLDYLGYWSIIKDFSDDNALLLTYTVPILDATGEAIGVVGVEIAQDYLYKFLPDDEFGDIGSYGYIFAQIELDKNKQEEVLINPIMLNGSIQQNLINYNYNNNNSLLLKEIDLAKHDLDVYPMLYETNNKDKTNVCMYLEKLNIYPNNTPFEKKQIYIVGMVNLENIISFTNDFWHSMFVMFGISIISGIIISYLAGKNFAKPIIKLSKAVSMNDVRQEIKLPKTNIKELDDLSNVIKQLQQENMLRNTTKTDKIFELLNIGVSSFEYIKGAEYVTVSEAMYKMLDIKVNNNNNLMQTIEKELFFNKLNNIKQNQIEEVKNIYRINFSDNNYKYYKIEEYEQEDAILGVIEDTTKDVEDLLVLNYERNYDLLTGIFNRRGFNEKVDNVFTNKNNKISLFVMFDLDNLKYVNDTFGHDSGDLYIKTSANIISTSLKDYGVVGRMSGDEFYAYLYGFDSEEEAKETLNKLYKRLEEEPIQMPNLEYFQIKMSGGIAWYEKDSKDLNELIKFADFAMYEGKLSSKGELREFNKDRYINKIK